MRVRLLLNLALMIALVGVAALIFWSRRDAAAGLVDLVPEDVRRIAVDKRNGEAYVLEREAGRWWLTAPRRLPASELYVGNVLKLLSRQAEARYAVADMDLARLGLAKPALSVRFDTDEFVFGDLDPLGRRRYIRHDEHVLLVREGVSPLLGAPWWNFLARRLVPEGRRVVAVALNDGRRIEESAYLRTWSEAYAQLAAPEQGAAAGERFVVVLDSGERLEFVAASEGAKRLLRPELGIAYSVSGELFTALTLSE